jgi:hypothetical protein
MELTSTPEKISSVEHALDALGKMVDGLQTSANQLEKALEPVLSQAAPADKADEAKTRPAVECQLAEKILNQAERVESVTALLNSIRHRLEL